MKSLKIYLSLTFSLFAFPVLMCGQAKHTPTDSLFSNARLLQENYLFVEAKDIYNELLNYDLDSAFRTEIHTRIIQCHNGDNLLGYIVRPTAIATDDWSIENFFLHIEDIHKNSWMPIPNPFVNIPPTAANPFCNGTYFSTEMENDGRIIYSAPNEAGQWKIYTSSRIDSTLWSLPQLLSANIVSGGNEIFPHLSPDGRTLYFASDALAGMGGYDLFYSTLDPATGSWSSPENMGFPYSSTGNDIFYADTPDGKYTIVVSDRETNEGKVRIYITRHIANAVKTQLKDDENPTVIASMTGTMGKIEVSGQENTFDNTKLSRTDSLMLDYSDMMAQLEELRNTHDDRLSLLEEKRNLYIKSDAGEKESISKEIISIEREAMQIKMHIDQMTKDVQKAEMYFITNGIVPEIIKTPATEPEIELSTVDKKDVYIFPNYKLRTIPYIVLEQPKPKFDYTFKIGGKNEGQFAEDQNLPDGVVYQIQFAVLSKKASIKDLKGLSPVYAYRQSSGKYIHTVGLFRTYGEASSKVKAVRNAGFKEAFLVAYQDGKSISVKTARQQEGKATNNTSNAWQLIITGYSDTLPSGVITAIRDASHKDITKAVNNTGTSFVVGPFSKKSEASELAELLKGLGVTGVSIENINIK